MNETYKLNYGINSKDEEIQEIKLRIYYKMKLCIVFIHGYKITVNLSCFMYLVMLI